MSRRPSIADAMREAGGGTRAPSRATTTATANRMSQPGRARTKAITGHFPPEVRHQLKVLAAEQDRTMEDMLAEALNMLFSAYHKPEVAPVKRAGGQSGG
ncbi:MAG: hypothetical protein OXI73_03595 [Rhodospirillales bacterium]|nr:hypothetical protein [Rhodospirillales bacterium]